MHLGEKKSEEGLIPVCDIHANHRTLLLMEVCISYKNQKANFKKFLILHNIKS